MAGLHFFYPVALKNIAEIIKMNETSAETIEKIKTFLKEIRRNFLLLDEPNSFILNRICLGFQNEAFLLVNEREATIPQIDRIVRTHFFPQGIFEFFDSVGLDVMLASIRNYAKADPEANRFQSLILQLEKLVSEGKLGNKTRAGFYTDEVTHDPGDTSRDADLILRLQESYASSFRKLSISSGISTADLKSAMDEYFGSDSPNVSE